MPPTATFEFNLRVYYEDTDAGGVVFYANYLKFFERARTEWLRAGGISQQRFAEETGLMFVVRSTAVDYLRPARLDDLLTIRSRVDKLGRVAVEFHQEAWRPDSAGSSELLATGRIKVACVARDGLRPSAMPESIRTALHQENIRP